MPPPPLPLLLLLQLVEAGDAASYAAGTREAALHAMAGRHPNIVPLLDAFEHRSPAGRHACMVLERCGSNLLYVSLTWAPVLVLLCMRGSSGNVACTGAA